MRPLLLVSSVLWLSAYASALLNNGKTYAKMNDGRCLFTNVSMSTWNVFNDLQCSALCNQNANCTMYMVGSNKCYLYAGMRPSFYNAVSYNASSPTECTVYTAGWGQCPPTTYTFNNKYYYITRTLMNSTQAFAYCQSNGLAMLKIESYEEIWYLGQVVMGTNGFIGIWIGLQGSYASQNLTWIADRTALNSSSLSPVTWIIRLAASLNPFCYSLAPLLVPNFIIYDEYCNSALSLYYPVCTCQ